MVCPGHRRGCCIKCIFVGHHGKTQALVDTAVKIDTAKGIWIQKVAAMVMYNYITYYINTNLLPDTGTG